MNCKDAADRLGCSYHALTTLRAEGIGPVWHRLPNARVEYDPASVDAYAQARAAGATHIQATERAVPKRERPTQLGAMLKAWTNPAWQEDTEIAFHLAEFQARVAQAETTHRDDAELRAAAVRIAGLQFAAACQETAVAASGIMQRIEALSAAVRAVAGDEGRVSP